MEAGVEAVGMFGDSFELGRPIGRTTLGILTGLGLTVVVSVVSSDFPRMTTTSPTLHAGWHQSCRAVEESALATDISIQRQDDSQLMSNNQTSLNNMLAPPQPPMMRICLSSRVIWVCPYLGLGCRPENISLLDQVSCTRSKSQTSLVLEPWP